MVTFSFSVHTITKAKQSNRQGGARAVDLGGGALFVPRTTTTLGMRSFAVAGPRIWNSLPAARRTATLSPLTFDRHLKSHLFD